jgi:hypothetical protein
MGGVQWIDLSINDLKKGDDSLRQEIGTFDHPVGKKT